MLGRDQAFGWAAWEPSKPSSGFVGSPIDPLFDASKPKATGHETRHETFT